MLIEDYPIRTDRPSWDLTWSRMADLIHLRSTCQRYQVGCVITTPDHTRVLAVGYNGNYAGGKNACTGDPTVPGGCLCLHAEMNALLKCDNRVKDKVIYVTAAPCIMCAKAIINSGAGRIVYSDAYRHSDGVDLLESVGILTTVVDLTQ